LSWSVLTSFFWMSLLSCPLRKKYCIITLCSIRSIQIFITYLNIPYRISQISIKHGPQRQTLSVFFLARHIWLIQTLISLGRCYAAMDNSQSWERSARGRCFFATL
jgi:hypothetical protein